MPEGKREEAKVCVREMIVSWQLMAELMFRKANYEKAVEHYQNLLHKTPGLQLTLFKLFKILCIWLRYGG